VIIATTQNAGEGRSFGGSADIAFKPFPDDTLHFGVEYLNTKYTDFVFQSPIAGGLRFISPVGTGCVLTENSAATTQTVNCSGKPFTRSPKWFGVASYVHSFELANGAKIDAKGDMSFQSSRWLGTEYLVNAAPYALFNASLTYRSASDALTVSAFIRNIADKAVFTASKNSSFVPDFETVTISPPRTFGMRVSYKY